MYPLQINNSKMKLSNNNIKLNPIPTKLNENCGRLKTDTIIGKKRTDQANLLASL